MSNLKSFNDMTGGSYQITRSCGLIYNSGGPFSMDVSSKDVQELFELFRKETDFREDVLNYIRDENSELERHPAYISAVVDVYSDMRTDALYDWETCIEEAFGRVAFEEYKGIPAPVRTAMNGEARILENGDVELRSRAPHVPVQVIPASHVRKMLEEYQKEVFFREDIVNELQISNPEMADNKAYVDAILEDYADLRTDANMNWEDCLLSAINNVDEDKYAPKKGRENVER